MSGESTTARTGRRRIGLRLRGLLVVVALAAAWLGWVADRAHRRDRAARAIELVGGEVYYDDQPTPYDPKSAPPSGARRWLTRLVGDDPFRQIREVRLNWRWSVPHKSMNAAIPALDDCPALEGLYLLNLDLSDAEVEHIGRATTLRILHMESVECSEASLAPLANLRKLTVLDVTRSRVDDRQLAAIRGLSRLEKLRLSWLKGPGIGDEGLSHMAGLVRLKELELADNTRITDEGCRSLAGLKSLTWLDLDGTGVGDAGVPRLENLRSLQELRLEKTRVTDDGLRSLTPLKGLLVLRVNDAPVTAGGVASLQASNPGLRFLFTSLR